MTTLRKTPSYRRYLRDEVFVSVQSCEEVSAGTRRFPVNAQVPAPHEKYHVVHGVGACQQRGVGGRILGRIGHRPTRESCHLDYF